ncbi:Multiple C2 and transmembrane domain-containing protein 1 [Anabarilius grahami]|uniref:Multiple C2 and transmembrane domain-containing protein 1 n=1 Tax=Anabarilius grahami TaxID=495550 RepID=A0A3N0Y465_ANAGA|nr:Multiple C2 and transmembrane domain-containing protein 1 [Anabarilius grahami]
MCYKCLNVNCYQEHALLRARPRASVSLALRALTACCRCCCWTGTMEEKHKDESPKDPQSASYQRRMWRNFQEKTKPFLSPKLGSERRSGDSKKESGLWMFKRKKKQVLDRVFSSSQPNLCSSTPPSFVGDSTLCEQPDTSAGKGLGISPLAVADGASVSKPEISVSAHGSPKLLVAHLAMSQQKSSSLGSACFEKLVVDSAASSEDELAKNASDLVRVILKYKVTRKCDFCIIRNVFIFTFLPVLLVLKHILSYTF